MTDKELMELVEAEGLAGMMATIFTINRIYTGRVARINVTTLMLSDPKVADIGDTEPHEIMATPSIADTVEQDPAMPGAHKYVAVAIEQIEAIGF